MPFGVLSDNNNFKKTQRFSDVAFFLSLFMDSEPVIYIIQFIETNYSEK